jgi:hypothetical protein
MLVSVSACFNAAKNIKSTLRAFIPRGVRVKVFVSNPFEPDTLFIKCVPRGVRCTLPFRPAKAVPYLSRKYSQQRKRVSRQNGREPF